MEELKKSLSSKYLEMGEYFNKAFELFPKVMKKEVILVGIMILLNIIVFFTIKTPIYYIILMFSGFVSSLLLQKVIRSIDKVDCLSFEEEKSNNNMMKCIIIVLFCIIPIVSLIFVIFCLIYPYFMASYLNENMTVKEAYEYSKEISQRNRMRVILPIFIIMVCNNVITKALVFYMSVKGYIISAIVSLTMGILFISIYSIIYLNVKYMNEKKDNNNQNIIEIE